jgi:hypothetical protein
MDSNQQFKWALVVVDCMKALRAEGFPFVDQEVIPNLDGSPNGISAWFICEHRSARERFDVEAARKALSDKLRVADFPRSGVETLQTAVTSQAEVQAGAGRFYFFR